MSVWGGGGVEGLGLGSGGFLSDVFFFQIGGPITAGLISGREAYIVLGEGGLFSDIFFFYVGGPITAGLTSGRGAYIGGRGGGGIIG